MESFGLSKTILDMMDIEERERLIAKMKQKGIEICVVEQHEPAMKVPNISKELAEAIAALDNLMKDSLDFTNEKHRKLYHWFSVKFK